ncbi:MAG TPA: aldo/keto reductase [Solirubrobacterales bacterium]|jgi:2,5-diketo-D-gluconate reductase A|nr:aldo/keto reductase [Solirubrobacterales bacterium]
MSDVASIPVVELHDGVEVPQLGFGVFQVPPEITQKVVEEALASGYRHIDTAAIYGNEEGVGAALAATGIPREEIFVTTKLWNSEQGYDSTLRALEGSLEKLRLERVDLYLIHWPMPAEDRYLDTWRAFERLRGEGGTRSIGVSNFRLEELERLRAEAKLQPTVNQIELHPRLQQAELRAWHAAHGVATEAWSPLAQGEVLAEEAILAMAENHGRTPAQVILRWHLQLGNIVFPKSVTPERIRENIEVFDFELEVNEMEAMAPLDAGERVGPDPSTFTTQ